MILIKKQFLNIAVIISTGLLIFYEFILPALYYFDKLVDCSNKQDLLHEVISNRQLFLRINFPDVVFNFILQFELNLYLFAITIIIVTILLIIIYAMISIHNENRINWKHCIYILSICSIPFLLVSDIHYSYLYYRMDYCKGNVTNDLTCQYFPINFLLNLLLIAAMFIYGKYNLAAKKKIPKRVLLAETGAAIIINLIFPFTVID